MNEETISKENNIFKDCDKKFASIIKRMKESGQILDTHKLSDAYEMAKKAHGTTKRKSGELYIYHPIAVFKKMYDDGFVATDVLIAALLHDVVEDTNVTLEQIEEKFGPLVRKYVDGVTNCESAFITDSHLIETTNESESRYVAYIKFADRWHNLNTCSCMSQKSINHNVEHTKKILVPLARRLGCNAMADQLLDACFLAQHPKEYESISAQMHSFLGNRIDSFYSTINKIKTLFSQNQEAEFYQNNRNVFRELPLPYSIAESIKRNTNDADLTRKDSFSFYNFKPYHIVYLLFENEQTTYKNVFIEKCLSLITDCSISIWNEQKDDNIQNTQIDYIDIRDACFNRIRIVLCYKENFWKYRNAIASLDNSQITYASILPKENRIEVYTKDGAKFDIEKGATVLDFAFILHNEIGLHYGYALVNENQKDMDYILQSGDQIEIIKAEETTAELSWFNILQTKTATKRLVKYFQNIQKISSN